MKTHYLIQIWGDVDPQEPIECYNDDDRLAKARGLRMDDPDKDHGLYRLDVDWNSKTIDFCSFSGMELDDELFEHDHTRIIKLKDLPEGAKLMWDAPLPFQGYDAGTSLVRDKILYTVTVGEHHKLKIEPQASLRKIYSGKHGKAMWLDSSPQLRYPTLKELEAYEWALTKSQREMKEFDNHVL